MPNMDPSQLATGGGGMPPQQGGGMPQGTFTPERSQVGGNINKLLEVLSMAIQQAVDEQGFVDMEQLIQIWPQIAQQGGVNIPFQTVMQMIQQNPNMIEDLIIRHGLAGIIMQGRRITAEQLTGMGTGAV